MSDDIDYPREYDNSGRVENAAELIEAYTKDAAAFREEIGDAFDADLVYGPKERNKLDIVWPENRDACPIVLFIHGGYWQRMDRSDFTHMAAALRQRGCAVALPSYTLAPAARINEIINEVRRACLLLYQTHGRKITAVGHSAGGHLAACMLATDWQRIHRDLPEDLICSGLGISGLYDLIPLTKTPVNDAVQMDESSAYQASPIHWVPEGLQRFEAWVGGDESNEYHRQSRDLSQRWTMLGTPTSYVSVERKNHFTVVDALTDPDSKMVEAILSLVQKPAIAVSPDGTPLAAGGAEESASSPSEDVEELHDEDTNDVLEIGESGDQNETPADTDDPIPDEPPTQEGHIDDKSPDGTQETVADQTEDQDTAHDDGPLRNRSDLTTEEVESDAVDGDDGNTTFNDEPDEEEHVAEDARSADSEPEEDDEDKKQATTPDK